MPQRAIVYAAACLVGLAAVLWVLPLDTLLGRGPGWAMPGADDAQALTGHLAFQADQWRWPLLETQRLFWPRGVSLLLVDGNPLVSILAKLWTHAVGSQPVNWLGGFLGACWLLQAVAGCYAARGLKVRPVAALAAAALACAWPALMFRTMHINLCAQFLILVALGMAFRRIDRPMSAGRAWLPPALLLLLAILVHPYLFMLSAVVLAAVPLQAMIGRRAGWQQELGGYLLASVTAVGVLTLIAGPLGGGDKGFTFFSMNLLSPVWPQRSGVFGASRPILDATGGQYEGMNWLGAGTLLLVLAAAVAAGRRRAWPRPGAGLLLVLAGLALLSLSSRVYAGPLKLIDLGDKPWEDLFSMFRASGRAFWPAGYALMLGGVAAADRLPRLWGGALLVAAVALQVVDVQPLRHDATLAWADGAGEAVPAVPAGTTLFGVAPFPGCAQDAQTRRQAPAMLLDAVRQGARTTDVGLGRPPGWFSCEAVASDALELPLLPHEARAFIGAPIQASVHPELLGPDAVCRRVAPSRPGGRSPAIDAAPVTLCGRDVAAFDGMPVLARPLPPPVALPFEAGPEGLAPVLGFGWKLGMVGQAWSEGPRSSLLIRVPTGRRLELRLRAAGVSFRPGDPRQVTVTVGRLPVGQFTLPDEFVTDVTVAIPASTIEDGIMRVGLSVARPVDPARRGLAAPVRRAAIQLISLSLRVEESAEIP